MKQFIAWLLIPILIPFAALWFAGKALFDFFVWLTVMTYAAQECGHQDVWIWELKDIGGSSL